MCSYMFRWFPCMCLTCSYRVSLGSIIWLQFSLVERSPRPSSEKLKIMIITFDFLEAVKKPVDLWYASVKGVLLAPETQFWSSETGATNDQWHEKLRLWAVGKIGGTEAGLGHGPGRCLVSGRLVCLSRLARVAVLCVCLVCLGSLSSLGSLSCLSVLGRCLVCTRLYSSVCLGRGRGWVGKSRTSNEKGRQGASWATNRRKQKVKRQSLSIKIDILRLLTPRPLHVWI